MRQLVAGGANFGCARYGVEATRGPLQRFIQAGHFHDEVAARVVLGIRIRAIVNLTLAGTQLDARAPK